MQERCPMLLGVQLLNFQMETGAAGVQVCPNRFKNKCNYPISSLNLSRFAGVSEAGPPRRAVFASWGGKREPAGEILSAKREGSLPYVLIKALQIFPHRHHELVRVGAVDNTVIVADAQPDDVANRNGIGTVLIRDHHRLLEDAAHAQDGHLRLQDDRQPELRPENPGIGDGDGPALDVVGNKFLTARTLAQVADRSE